MTPPTMSATADTHASATSVTSAEPDPTGAPLLEHEYDGIRELDNPLPGWWRATFYVSIVFAIVYWIVFHVAHVAELPDQKYRTAKVEYSSVYSAGAAEIATASEELLASGARDSAVIAKGKEVFAARCASCHSADGRGMIGPNLTDLVQLHGETRVHLFNTIRDGVPGTAMLAWGSQLPAFDITAVATYVSTLRGQNLPGKEPQGHPVGAFAP